MKEAELLLKLKAGDKAAFEQLINAYSRSVINTCYRFLLNEKDAEDISQEVFIEVFQSIRAFKGNSKISTWIYRIAVTKSLDEIKKRNRKKRISSIGKLLKLEDISQWMGGGKQPDQVLHEKEKMKEVMNALNTLPDSQRVAFTLSKMDGYNHLEIAEIMDTTVISVESLIYRAKKKMTQKLQLILTKKND